MQEIGYNQVFRGVIIEKYTGRLRITPEELF
jgi:hypothetical protein